MKKLLMLCVALLFVVGCEVNMITGDENQENSGPKPEVADTTNSAGGACATSAAAEQSE